jgi:hypothetical protein
MDFLNWAAISGILKISKAAVKKDAVKIFIYAGSGEFFAQLSCPVFNR